MLRAPVGGEELGTEGDAFTVVFTDARAAVAFAADAQASLAAHPWPEQGQIRVRMGMHTGEAAVTASGWVGLAIHEAARVCSAAHGGQVLVTEATMAAAGAALVG
jgi:class 3 adenylate cyclase